MAAAAAAASGSAPGQTGLAMKRGGLFSLLLRAALMLGALLLLMTTAQAGPNTNPIETSRAATGWHDLWGNLWHNADQQGELLMQQGKPAAAAHTYRDPRHKAYAELQAGDFQEAAKHFAAFNDSNGNYNRGNALAQAGKLDEAIKAYDAALAHDPNDQDARHNRDLVARALQQSRPSADNPPSSGKDKNDEKNKSNQESKDNLGKQGDPSKNSSGQNQPAPNQSAPNQSGQNQSGQNSDAKRQDAKLGSNGKQGQSDLSNQPAPTSQSQSAQPQTGQANPSAPKPDDSAHARRDALDAPGQSHAGKSPAEKSDAPVTEQQLAQEQWLRRLPDDPGGLLRRKFMIEHLIRQQGGQP